ncbi:conserved hypothetical protein [Candidatus Zixiibacteriota bacterium]|nr:conserved hypothetical protein [candidate division Zixibacteria bacterium]
MRMLRRLIIVILTAIPLAAYGQADISIQISLNRDTIGIGEQAVLTATITGTVQNLPKPDLPNLTAFNVYSQGTSTNISIINGKMTSSQSYQYVLQPIKPGSFPIKPVTLVYNNQRFVSNELTLTVVGSSGVSTPKNLQQQATPTASDNRDIFLTAEVDKRTAFVNEQITLTIKFYTAVQLYSQPEYNAPQTTDFWANALEGQKSYYQLINGRRYNVIEISTALFPTRPGSLQIGSAMVTAMVAVKRQPRANDPFAMFDDMFTQGEQRSVRSSPLTVKVVPLPLEGKPSTYTGTVGDYTIESQPDKLNVDVNQPVTVQYKISGTGNIKTVAEPDIAETMDFRIYRASSNEKITNIGGVVGGTKIFEETYIPKRAGKLEIPPVKLDFFNPRAKKYKSIASNPITIEVRPIAEGGTEAPMVAVPGLVIEQNAKDIRYIKTDPGNLGTPRPLVLLTPIYLLVNGLPVVLLAALYINRKRRERLTTDIGYARSRAAKKIARRHLSSARKRARVNQAAAFYAELRRALFSYVADKKNISVHGLTGDQLLDILKEAGIDEKFLAMAKDLFRRADFAQYAPGTIDQGKIDESLRAAEELLVKLEEVRFA